MRFRFTDQYILFTTKLVNLFVGNGEERSQLF